MFDFAHRKFIVMHGIYRLHEKWRCIWFI